MQTYHKPNRARLTAGELSPAQLTQAEYIAIALRIPRARPQPKAALALRKFSWEGSARA